MHVALTIGGLDPSGGAGIVADVRALRAAGAWSCAVCAAITVQSTRGLRRVEPVATALLKAQLDELLADVRVRAIKTGALGSAANLRAVAEAVAARPRIPLVVDPVLAPSRTAGQLNGVGQLNAVGRRPVQAMRPLLERASLLTPNADEAARMLSTTIETPAHARDAAVALLELGPAAVLLKGGHLAPQRMVSDWLATPRGVDRLSSRRRSKEIHGTGCTLASLIAGRLAMRDTRARVGRGELLAIVRWARAALGRWMRRPLRIGGGLFVLGGSLR